MRGLGRARCLTCSVFVNCVLEFSFMAESSKRKTWKNIISTSSEEESFSPLDKKLKCGKRSDSEGSQSTDEITKAFNMAGSIMPKLEMIFEKLGKVEAKLDKLEKYVKAVDSKMSELQGKMKSFGKGMQDGKISQRACRWYALCKLWGKKALRESGFRNPIDVCLRENRE